MDKLNGFLVKSISYNMLLQVSFRLVSFVLNAVLIRHVNTELIGTCNFRLTLLYTTVLFLSREPFRRALPNVQQLLKSKEDDDKADKRTVYSFIKSLWLVVPNGLFISSIFGTIWLLLLSRPDEGLVKNYGLSVAVCCLACVIELIAEPFNSLAQIFLLSKLKVVVEAISLLVFNLTFVFLAIFAPSFGSMAFSVARLIYSLIFLASNVYSVLKNLNKNPDSKGLASELFNVKSGSLTIGHLLPFKSLGERFDRTYLGLVKAYYAQSIFKQVLTEGERYLITLFNLLSISESGIYDLVNNLGSLIARFIFLPIEDQSYIYFTNAFKRGSSYRAQEQQRETLISVADKTSPKASPKSSFERLLKVVCIIGVLVVVFGQSYAQLALQLYGGDKLGGQFVYVNMLRFHCVYILLLAINGVTESFYNATMSESQLGTHNYRMLQFSAFYLFTATLLAKVIHIYGFLVANCLNMALRIFFSSKHIVQTFKGYEYMNEEWVGEKRVYDLHKIFLPDAYVGVVLLISLAVTKLTESLYLDHLSASKSIVNVFTLAHFACGALFFLLTLLTIFMREKRLSSFVGSLLKRK